MEIKSGFWIVAALWLSVVAVGCGDDTDDLPQRAFAGETSEGDGAQGAAAAASSNGTTASEEGDPQDAQEAPLHAGAIERVAPAMYLPLKGETIDTRPPIIELSGFEPMVIIAND